ncbi:MAG: filamentous hemagglutinin N-terminal domain-containing protein, partial [Verrucomicrobiales bacterium]|nr:filamentous hemagglutinin N-terminal domain-containing protein [Verrucomicrobiales bacterium]
MKITEAPKLRTTSASFASPRGQRETGDSAPTLRSASRMIVLALLSALLVPGTLRANPSGGEVAAGVAGITSQGSTLTITQGSDRAIINWQDFSIAAGQTTQFLQPSSTSAMLNRVMGGNPSQIYGNLQANGQIYLINPNGILVGASGVVNTAGFLASTLDVSDDSFLRGGDLRYTGTSNASVVNLGSISATEGDVILIARTVENHGEIRAPNGTAALAAGSEVLVKAAGEERVFVQSESGRSDASVTQSGMIEAATAELKAAGGNEYALAIKHSGVTRATGVRKSGGRIFLSAGGKGGVSNSGRLVARKSRGGGGEVKVRAGGNVTNDGVIDAAGTKGGSVEIVAERASHTGLILADGTNGVGGTVTLTTRDGYHDTRDARISARGETDGGSIRVESSEVGARIYSSSTMDVVGNAGSGGSIVVTADELYLMGSRLLANGAIGGGEIFAGGGIQGGASAIANATTLYVNQTSLLSANATNQGDGGTVVLWAEGTTQFFGRIEAKGGFLGGDGGFLEVSGKEGTRFGGFATAEAPLGVGGTLLLDPKNIVVDAVASGGSGLLFSDNPADNITITAATITAITNTGTSIILQANNDITVNSAITTNNPSGDGGGITMQAGRSILLNASITTDNGSLTLVANETLANGVVDAHRDAGNAVITMASGTSINAGTGTVSLTLADGAGKTNLGSGAITLRGITGG